MSAYSFSTHGLAMRKVPQGVLDTVNQLLFDAGQVGGNLSFTDFSKIWQDPAGTTPYTAVEQYAGLLLSKAVPQVSNGTARVNIIADSTNFASTATCVITNNKFVATAASGYHTYTTSTMAPGAVYKIKLKVKAAEYTKLYISDMYNGNFAVAVDLVALTYSDAKRTATNISVTSLGSGIVEVQLTVTDYGGGASVVSAIGYPSTGATLDFWGAQYTGDGVSGLYVYAVDVRLLSDEAVLPAYQRIDNNVWVPYSSGCFYQTTSAARPVVSARVNLLTKTEQFGDGFWTKARSSITANTVVAPDGTLTGDKLVEDTATGLHIATKANIFTNDGVPRAWSIYVKAAERRYVALSATNVFSAIVNVYIFDALDGAWTQTTTDTAYALSFSSKSVGNGWWKISFTSNINNGAYVNFSIGLSPLPTGVASTNLSYTGDGASGIYIWGASLVHASQSNLPYQSVNTPTDYDTAGFPNYSKFDGIDDNIVSAAGGGGTAGIYFCGAIQFNKVGAAQTILSDYISGTNSGYALTLSSNNKLTLVVGNGSIYTLAQTGNTFALGDVALCEFWDDGTNLGVRLGEGTPVTVARPVVTAGTAQITLGKDNNAASNYAGISMFEPVWRYGAMPNATQREAIRAICRAKAGIV